MKRKFRIYEKLTDKGNVVYFVKQLWLGLFWTTPEFRPLKDGYCSPTPTFFYSMEEVKASLEEVKEVMEKQKKSYVKIVEYVTIEV